MLFQKATIRKIWQYCHPSTRQREQTIILITSICLVLSLLLSFDLWFRYDRLFLPVPILPIMDQLPLWTDWILFGSVIISVFALLLEPKYKIAALLFPVIFVIWILQDNLRWQPFFYMYAFVFLTVFLNRRKTDETRLFPLQIMVIGVYFWAGIGKLNPYFHEVVFPWFVQNWIADQKTAVSLSYFVPIFELLTGVFLAIPRLRNIGLLAGLGMLAVVLLCLGPFGWNWGMIVWPWNVFLFFMGCACFICTDKKNIFTRQNLATPAGMLAILLFWILPLCGQFGYWGPHPSFKLYSGDVPLAVIVLDKNEGIEKLPSDVSSITTPDGKIDLVSWTINEFMVAPTPSVPGYASYLAGAKGLCPYLQHPKNAYIQIVMNKPEQIETFISREHLCH